MKKKLEVEIFGKRYTVRSDLGSHDILRIARYVDDKMQGVKENTSIVSTSAIAVLAALNITEEFFQLRLQKEAIEDVVEQRSSKLIELLEEGIN